MTRSKRDLIWVPTFAVLVALAVPWFLWGVDTVVAGLPIWLWWHVGWMGLCTLLFYRFTRGAWDRGMSFDADLARSAAASKSAYAVADSGRSVGADSGRRTSDADGRRTADSDDPERGDHE